jgi:uncharacterized surface protein with fasciclin (FAS1) repeats
MQIEKQKRGEEMKSASFALILTVLMGVMPASSAAGDKNIVDTAVSAGSFTTLVTALQAAGLSKL